MPRITGADQMRAVARDLRAAGSPAKGLRTKLRRNLRAAAEPMKSRAQSKVLASPGSSGHGLRAEIASAMSIKTTLGVNSVLIRVWVNPAKMPADRRNLPLLVEGIRPWRHPLFGNTGHWYDQAAHPYLAPAAAETLPEVQAAVTRAVDQTAFILERGI